MLQTGLCPHTIRLCRSSLKEGEICSLRLWRGHKKQMRTMKWPERTHRVTLESQAPHTQLRWHVCHHSLQSHVHVFSWDFCSVLVSPKTASHISLEMNLFYFILFYFRTLNTQGGKKSENALKGNEMVNFRVAKDYLSTIQLHFHSCGEQILQLHPGQEGLTSSCLQMWV